MTSTKELARFFDVNVDDYDEIIIRVSAKMSKLPQSFSYPSIK